MLYDQKKKVLHELDFLLSIRGDRVQKVAALRAVEMSAKRMADGIEERERYQLQKPVGQ